MTLQMTLTSSYIIVGLFKFKGKSIHIYIYTFWYINKSYKSKKAGQLLICTWINKAKWIFSVSLDYVFTKNRYSWISHANLAIWWWSHSQVKFVQSVLVFACHVMILSWTTTTPEFFFATLVIIKKTYWWFIDYICNIYLIL